MIVKKFLSNLVSFLAFIFTPIFCISFSAFIPCFFRVFYYSCITPLSIPEKSGYSIEVIKEAFDGVMDYIWKGAEFSTGSLRFSEEGKQHFADCVPLFWLQLILVLISTVFFVAYFILLKKKVLNKVYPKGLSPVSYGGFATVLLLSSVGVYAAIDFDGLFTLFHKTFFPGKDNWIFDYRKDEIIKILPEEFFLVCAVFIISLAVILSIVAIVVGFIRRKKS